MSLPEFFSLDISARDDDALGAVVLGELSTFLPLSPSLSLSTACVYTRYMYTYLLRLSVFLRMRRAGE